MEWKICGIDSSIHRGASGSRTRDLFVANEALYRLSYNGVEERRSTGDRPSTLVAEAGFEPATYGL